MNHFHPYLKTIPRLSSTSIAFFLRVAHDFIDRSNIVSYVSISMTSAPPGVLRLGLSCDRFTQHLVWLKCVAVFMPHFLFVIDPLICVDLPLFLCPVYVSLPLLFRHCYSVCPYCFHHPTLSVFSFLPPICTLHLLFLLPVDAVLVYSLSIHHSILSAPNFLLSHPSCIPQSTLSIHPIFSQFMLGDPLCVIYCMLFFPLLFAIISWFLLHLCWLSCSSPALANLEINCHPIVIPWNQNHFVWYNFSMYFQSSRQVKIFDHYQPLHIRYCSQVIWVSKLNVFFLYTPSSTFPSSERKI